MGEKCRECGNVFHAYQWPVCPHPDEMQKYRGPKTMVWAAKIRKIEAMGERKWRPIGRRKPLHRDGSYLVLDVANPMPGTAASGVHKADAWMEDYGPQVGGYYFIAKDGNASYSPADVFEMHFKPVAEGT